MGNSQRSGGPDPKDRLETYAAKAVGERLDRLVHDLERVGRCPRADPVHDLRVAVRRLDSALVVFRPELPRKASAAIRKKLSRLRQFAGAVRDRDICLGLGEADMAAKPASVDRLLAGREQAAGKLQKRVRKLLRKNPGTAWRRELRLPPYARQGENTGPRAASFAAATLPEMARRFFLAGRLAARRGPQAVPLHPLRIRGKKLRYCLELFAPCYGPEIDELIVSLKKVQDFLGDINDCKAADPLLTGGASSEESGRIRGALKARDQHLFEQFRQYWAKTFDASGELETWLLMLGRGA